MEKRYQALRVVGVVYKVLGVLAAVLTVLAVMAVCAGSAAGSATVRSLLGSQGLGLPSGMMRGTLESAITVASTLSAIIVALYGLFMAITLYAVGELISLLLAMEEHTRSTATLLQQHISPPAQTPPAPAP
jgi:hypothetical protein